MKPISRSTPEALLGLMRGYQGAAILGAAAELNLFAVLGTKAMPVQVLSRKLAADPRALTILLDALTALRVLTKRGQNYLVARDVAPLLLEGSSQCVLPMIQHQANCLRRWAQLAESVRSGRPPARIHSLLGEAGDCASFIGAMHVVNASSAAKVIRGVRPLQFQHLLDVGGASGTWTIEFLRACPTARATLFDLPPVIALAKHRLGAAKLLPRVRLVAGDYHRDQLPAGADLAWVSAIVHQNSRAQNRELFAKIHAALQPGGRIAVRDIIMEENRTMPAQGALFAVNMLVGTEAGGTFTFAELRDDLEAANFEDVALAQPDPGMDAVVTAKKGS